MLNDLRQANRLLASLSEITKVINTQGLDYDRQLTSILGIILAYLGVEQGSIMFIEKDDLVVRAASRPELVGLRQPLAARGRVASWVAQKGKPLYIRDISQDERFRPSGGDAYKKESLLSVPILHEGEAVGVINVSDRAGGKDLLQNDSRYLLEFTSLVVWLVVREALHRKIKRQRNTLKKRNEKLRRQEDLEAELSKMLLHDLKGPLSEVVANLDILSYSVEGDNREFLEAAQLATDRAVRMASDLVNVYKLEEGKLKLLKEEAEPGPLLAEAASGIRGLARIKGITLRLEADEGLPILFLDRVLILRVLQNLLTNGIGYSPAGTAVTLGCRHLPQRKRLEFRVEDQGPGIPADKQEAIFGKYARLSTQQDALVGAGLGLYFCKLAVELHRGEIGVESQLGRGSRFFFSLPVA
ncbi:MAG: ATP-binding protein [Desulfobacteraceae bacterium]|nr:ATP-binding protein [Desulfobacteraceae bacterium]